MMRDVYIVINDVSKIGGISRVALNLYKELKKYHRVKIITGNINIANKDYYDFAKNDIINLNIGSPHALNSRFKLLLWYLKYYKKLKRLNLENPVFIGIETYMNFLVANLKGKKILSEHTSYHRRFFTRLLRRFFYKKADYLVVLTEYDKKKYESFLKSVKVIPNFVYPSDKVSSLKNNNVLFVGHLNLTKGIDFLREIIKKTPYNFTLVGKGDFEYFKGLKNAVLKGELSEVENEYLNADVFIMTSRKEGFPMVLLEAKNYGLPVVSFDILTGPREIIKDKKDGFLVPFGDIDGFVQKLDILMKDYNLRKEFQKNAREDIKNYYPEKVIKKWLKIIES